MYLIAEGAKPSPFPDIKNVFDSIPLNALVRSSDDLIHFKCCARVKQVEPPRFFAIEKHNVALSCFKIAGQFTDWMICGFD